MDDGYLLEPALAAALPAQVVEDLQSWQAASGRRLRLDRTLTNGLTQAQVMVVFVDGPNEPTRKMVLKIAPVEIGTDWEADHHRIATASSPPAFVAKHLVSQPIEPFPMQDNWAAMFQDVAGGSLTKLRPLSVFSDAADFPSVAAKITAATLIDWNPATKILPLTLRDFLRTHLRHKLDDGESLHSWVEEQFGDPIFESPFLRFAGDPDGSVLVNPLLLAHPPAGSALAEVTVNTIVGNCHGDFHLENILLPAGRGGPDADNFRLIDLSAFKPDAPLSRDPVNLILSTLAKHLPTLGRPERRALFQVLVTDRDQTVRLELVGLSQTIKSILDAGASKYQADGLIDEWAEQQLLSLVGGSLVFASRPVYSEEIRIWFFELAAIAAGLWSKMREVSLTGSILDVGVPLSERKRKAQDAADVIASACSSFDGTTTTVAVLPSTRMSAYALSGLAAGAWDFVVDFDMETDVSGGYAVQQKLVLPCRLMRAGQQATFARGSTTWFAGDGLANQWNSDRLSARRWRANILPAIRQALSDLAIAHTSPVTLVLWGEVEERTRAVVEAALDLMDERLRIITVGESVDAGLSDYEAEHFDANAILVAGALPGRPADLNQRTITPTLPSGSTGRDLLVLDQTQVAWFEAVGELLHSQAGTSLSKDSTVAADFYRGQRVSLFELSVDIDVPRPSVLPYLLVLLRNELQDRGTRRLTFAHLPGSGGTTITRRAAWDLRQEYPILLVYGLSDHGPVAQRVRELSTLTDRSVLLVVENTTDSVTDRLYDELRTNNVPSVVLIVTRRTRSGGGDQIADSGRFMGLLDEDERAEFKRLFGALVPERRSDLNKLTSADAATAVPFYYALTAFQEDFSGLPSYVSRSLQEISDEEREILIIIALVHRYTGLPVPSDLFAARLNLPLSRPLRLTSRLSATAQGVLIQESAGRWRTLHPLIAEEVLRQLLTPPAASSMANAWKLALGSWYRELIAWVADVYSPVVPVEVKLLLEKLFLVRDNQDALGTTRSTFSEALADLPSSEGRLEVLSVLAETFPDEPHYWAHYGRLLSYDVHDHPLARMAIDRALELDSDDGVLRHMAGVIIRNEIRDLTRVRVPDLPADKLNLIERVQGLTLEALAQFADASEINDASEYPYVTTIELCILVIEWGKGISHAENFTIFLANVQNEFYSSLLDTAEEAMDRLLEIVGPDISLSRYAEGVRSNLRELYDDYAGLLQGWRNLLARDDVLKQPIRRRLVRAYRNRAGGWRKASSQQLSQALELLEQNLRDDPRDVVSQREWVRAARFVRTSLDRASEMVSYWVEAEPARDALFYDYVLSGLLALDGRHSALQDYRRKSARSRERVQNFPRRHAVYEWLGPGEGLGRLVHFTDLTSWERRTPDSPDPGLLQRVQGRVLNINRPQSGELEYGPGLTAFFTPSVSGIQQGRDENRRVSMLIGFAYDGPRAWSVRLEE